MTRKLQFFYSKDGLMWFYCWKENQHFNLGKVITLKYLKERIPNHDHKTVEESSEPTKLDANRTLEDEPTEGMG